LGQVVSSSERTSHRGPWKCPANGRVCASGHDDRLHPVRIYPLEPAKFTTLLIETVPERHP